MMKIGKISLKHFVSYGFAVAFQKFSGFIILPLLTASLTVEEFGMVNQFIYFAGIAILVVTLGLDEAVAKRGFHSRSDFNPYFLSAMLALALNGLLFILFIWFTKGFLYFKILGVTDIKLILLSIVYIVFSPFYYAYLKTLRLSKNSKEFFYATILATVIQVILLIFLVVIFNFGVMGYLLSYAITMFLNFLYVMYKMRLHLVLSSFSFQKIVNLVKYGFSIAPHTISTWGFLGFTVVAVGNLLGNEAAARFITINYIPTIASVTSYIFFFTFQPWLYDNLKNKINIVLLFKQGLQFIGIFFLLVVILSLLSEKIYNLLFNERYVFQINVFLVLIMGVFFQFISSMLTYILYYFEKYTKFVFLSTIFGVLINIGLFYLLTPFYKLVGAAISLLMANIGMMLIRLYIVHTALRTYNRD